MSRIKDKNVRITLVNPITWEYYDLYFKLYATDLAKKWVKSFEQMSVGDKRLREKSIKFSRSSTYTLDALADSGKVGQLNYIIDYLNIFYDREIRRVEVLDQDTLNYLHEEYEIYGIRLDEKLANKWWDVAWKTLSKDHAQAVRWPGLTFNEEFHSTFMKLNDMIHTLELFFNTSDPKEEHIIPKYSHANILVSHDPRIDYELTEEDCASFFANYRFGDLFLGYNTLGKNIWHIVADEDFRAAEENAVVLQTTWSNEIMATLEADNATPDGKTKRYNKFKKLGLERHGWKFGDHANREGYLLIGHMYGLQEDDIYSASSGMKIDLTAFSSVHSVEIVTDEQMTNAYKYPSSRHPSWKKPLPVQNKKIIEIKNEQRVIITWILNDICNYSCRYCPPALHNGRNHAFDWDVVEPFLNQLFSFYHQGQQRKLEFSLSGGEPTLSPFFPELVQKIYNLGGNVRITTNLVRTPRFIEENFKYLSGVSCSFHPAQEFPNKTVDEWIEKVKISSKLTYTSVRVMMDPLYWDQCIEFIERIKNETTSGLEIVYIDDQYGNSPLKISDISYTAEQAEFFKTFKKIYGRKTLKPLLKTNPVFRASPNTGAIIYEDKTVDFNHSYQELINNGQTNFFDYTCAIGKESMFIHQSGHIKRGNCNVGGIIGNVKNYDKIDWNSLLKPVLCNSVRCSCGSDIPISKKM